MIRKWLEQLLRRNQHPIAPTRTATRHTPDEIRAQDTANTSNGPQVLLRPFQIRPMDSGDLGELLGVFRQAIQVSAADQYDQQQRDAWSRAQSHESLISALSEGEAVVAEWDNVLVGFAHRINDYINMLFVHPNAGREGIATLLYQHLEDGARMEGITELAAHVSLTANGFFHFMGFTSEGQEEAERNGVSLARYPMRKPLI